tara:strand:+ start:220 stop:654 length:435 start_codon:yes stop_codon:yes gene_type:complete
MDIKKKDLEIGFKTEDLVLPILNDYFDTTLSKTKTYDVVDFENEKFCIELKKRNNNYMKYPTTLIPQNKINYMKKQLTLDRRCILVFHFDDGLYYIELNPSNIMNLEQNKRGGRNDRGICEFKNNGYCYIDIKLLTKIETEEKK